MKKKIMKMLAEYHTKQGVLFLSEEDAEKYFRGLTDSMYAVALDWIEKENENTHGDIDMIIWKLKR